MEKEAARHKYIFLVLCAMVILISGCLTSGGNVGELQSYPFPSREAEWILNGEPIEYETDLWYPKDGVENFLDSEVYLLGEYRGVQLFVEKQDVRPYDRIYTKFGRNQYRYFEKRKTK